MLHLRVYNIVPFSIKLFRRSNISPHEPRGLPSLATLFISIENIKTRVREQSDSWSQFASVNTHFRV